MRAIVIRSKGGPDVLELSDEPEPTPGADELLVAVEAVGVNYRDVYEREGRGAAYGRAPVPRIIGAEGAGTVLQGAGEFAAGDRVAWAAADGSYAEQAAVPVAQAVKVPDGTSSELAAAAILQGMTAHYLSHSTYPVQRDDITLAHAAAGGVGLLLVQMIKARGGYVAGRRRRRRRRLGARPRGGRGRDGRVTTGSATGCASSAGAHVIYDAIGATTFEAGMDALRARDDGPLRERPPGGRRPVSPAEAAGEVALPDAPRGCRPTRPRARSCCHARGRRAGLDRGRLADVRIGERDPLEDARARTRTWRRGARPAS